MDPSFKTQTAIKVGRQPMDMAFQGDELYVPCQGDGSVHVIDIPNRSTSAAFRLASVAVPGILTPSHGPR